MEIETHKLGGLRPTSSIPANPKGGVTSSVNGPGDHGGNDSEGVSVKLTDTASMLRAAQENLRSDLPIDAARVAELRDAIASGRYHVDAKRVAEKFMSLEPNL